MSEKNIPTLDGLRGVAILTVMIFHFTLRHRAVTIGGQWIEALGGLGWSGVDLFFVLSGFLITRILLRARGRRGYFRNFYMRRVLRIFPLYYGVLFVMLVVSRLFVSWRSPEMQALAGRAPWLWAYASNVFVAVHRNWAFSAGWVDLNHMWSLAVEEHFYLVWPFLVALLSARALTRACSTLVVGAPVMRFVAIKLLHLAPLATFVLTPFRMDALAFGGLLAYAVEDPSSALAKAVKTLATPAIVCGSVLVGSIVVLQHSPSQYSWPMQCVGFPGFELIYGGIIVNALAAKPGDRVHRILTSRALMQAGKYSYGGYVFHEILRGLVFEPYFSPPRFSPLPEALAILSHATVSIALSFAAAIASYHLFEKHFLKLKSRFEYAH